MTDLATEAKTSPKKLSSCVVCLDDFEAHDFRADSPYFSIVCDHMKKETCIACLDSWMKQHLGSSTITEKDFKIQDRLRCIITTCTSTYNLNDLLDSTGFARFPKTEQECTRMYLKQTEDIISCPNPTCTFAGTLPPKRCYEPFVCELCGTTWKDKSQFTNIFQMILRDPKEVKSYIVKYFTTKNCPGCQSPIQKNGGCRNMNCQSCRLAFCWLCLTPNSRHSPTCGARVILKGAIASSPLAYLYMKKGFFQYAKSYEVFKRPETFLQFFTFPVQIGGFIARLASYAGVCISGVICASFTLPIIFRSVRDSLRSIGNVFRRKFGWNELEPYQIRNLSRAQRQNYQASILFFMGFLGFLKFFGRRKEAFILFGYASMLGVVGLSSAFFSQ